MKPLRSAAALVLLAGAALSPVPAAASEPFTAEQRSALDAAIRDYIMKNPEVVMDSLRALQQREEQAESERQRLALVHLESELTRRPGDPVLGNPKGDVTVVEFFDYQCGYCKKMVEPMVELLKADGNLRWVMKELPILGPASEVAARASLAARKQNAYEKFHVALMGYKGRLSDAAIFQTAREVGLDLERLRADMASPEVEETIREAMVLAQSLGIRGTPAFVVGKDVLPGAVSKEELARLIAAARKG